MGISRGVGQRSGGALSSSLHLIKCLCTALERDGFSGYDPYDALRSQALRRLARRKVLRQAVIQANRRSPVNLRPLAGISPWPHAMGLALVASALSRLSHCWAPAQETSARLCTRMLGQRLRRSSGYGLGYAFDVQTRWGFYDQQTPNAVVTSFGCRALIDVDRDGYKAEIEAFRDFAMEELLSGDGSQHYFAYYPGGRTPIHNANILVAAMVAEAGGDIAALNQCIDFSLERQRADGSWPYGEHEGLGWVDGYHTAFLLDNLERCLVVLGRTADLQAVAHGLTFYLDHLIDGDGAPRASRAKRYPIDIHAAAFAIGVLSRLGYLDKRARPTAERIVKWTVDHMMKSDGTFAYQRHRTYMNSVPYFRWSNAPMLWGLSYFD